MKAFALILIVAASLSCRPRSATTADAGQEGATLAVPTGVAPLQNAGTPAPGGNAGGAPQQANPAMAGGGAPMGTPPAGAGGMVPAGAPAGMPPTQTEGLAKSRVYLSSSTSAAIAPGDSKVVAVSCQQGGDMLIEHRCSTDSKCGAIFEDGFIGKAGESDTTSCGARNTCSKGTISIEVTAVCYHF